MAEQEKNLYKLIWEELKKRVLSIESQFNEQRKDCDNELVKRTLDGEIFAIYLVKDFLEFLEKLYLEEREL